MKPLAPSALVLLLFTGVSPAVAQPDLSSLWPVDVGRAWEFDVRIEGPFTQVRTGTVTQTVAEQTPLPSGTTVSCFDIATALRPPQPAMLLAVPPCGVEAGFLVDEAVAVGVWVEANSDWAWWWVPADVSPGTTFRLPIRSWISADAVLDGEIRTLAGAVTVPLGAFADAVVVDYVVDLGESEIRDGSGNFLGTVRFETVGWVAFVPGVGPVASSEAFAPAEADCPDCPRSIFETITTTMELRATTSLAVERPRFGSLKARY